MEYRFNPPPNWPAPPAGWSPSAGWQPDPTWPPPPPGWPAVGPGRLRAAGTGRAQPVSREAGGAAKSDSPAAVGAVRVRCGSAVAAASASRAHLVRCASGLGEARDCSAAPRAVALAAHSARLRARRNRRPRAGPRISATTPPCQPHGGSCRRIGRSGQHRRRKRAGRRRPRPSLHPAAQDRSASSGCADVAGTSQDARNGEPNDADVVTADPDDHTLASADHYRSAEEAHDEATRARATSPHGQTGTPAHREDRQPPPDRSRQRRHRHRPNRGESGVLHRRRVQVRVLYRRGLVSEDRIGIRRTGMELEGGYADHSGSLARYGHLHATRRNRKRPTAAYRA